MPKVWPASVEFNPPQPNSSQRCIIGLPTVPCKPGRPLHPYLLSHRDLPCGVYRLLLYSDHLVALLQMRADTTTAAAMDEDTCNPITSLMCISFTCRQRAKISCGHFWYCLVGLASVNMGKPANMDKPAKRQINMNSHCIFTRHHAPTA